jgi:predicted nucleic acid-binding protein
MQVYWDTACLVKIYSQEVDSDLYLNRLQNTRLPLYSSILTSAEMSFALQQKENRRELKPGAAQTLHHDFLSDVNAGRVLLLPLGEDVVLEAARLARLAYQRAKPILLRTLDGLHLATARVAGCRELLTTDGRMQQAAALAGLRLARNLNS